MSVVVQTTGVLPIVIIGDRGLYEFTHPVTETVADNIDDDATWSYEQVRTSKDLANALDLNHISITNNGEVVANSDDLANIQPGGNTGGVQESGSGNLTKDPTAVMVTSLTSDAPNNWTPSGVDGNGDPQTWGKHIKLLVIEGNKDVDITSIDKADFEVGDGIDILNAKSQNKKIKLKANDNGSQVNRIGGKEDLEIERWAVGSLVRGYNNADRWCPRYYK